MKLNKIIEKNSRRLQLILCDEQQYSTAILTILNEAIVNSTALYDYHPRPPEAMQTWFQAKRAGNFPVIGLVDEAGALLGFGSYGTFRAWPAYKYSVEHSIYIRADQRGHGFGRILLQNLIEQAEQQHYHALIGAIDSTNQGSIALHEKLGFVRVGTFPQIGFKFGRWLDVAFYQFTLPTPTQPQDG